MTRLNETEQLARLQAFGGEVATADLTTTALVINYMGGSSLRFDELHAGATGEASRIAAVVMAKALGITNEKDVLALVYITSYCARVTLHIVGGGDRQVSVIAHSIFDR